jgi:hypothetical protein
VKLDVVLVAPLVGSLAAHLVAGVGMVGQGSLGRRQQKRPGTLQEQTDRQPSHPRARPLDAGRFEKVDQVAAVNVDLSGRIVPHEVVERWPAEQGADDARAFDRDTQLRVDIRPQRHAGTVP